MNGEIKKVTRLEDAEFQYSKGRQFGDQIRFKSLICKEINGSTDFLFRIGEMDPGEARLLHHYEKESEIYYILKGAAEITLDDEKVQARPGMAIYIPPGIKRKITNDGKSTFRIANLVYVPGEGSETKLAMVWDEGAGASPKKEEVRKAKTKASVITFEDLPGWDYSRMRPKDRSRHKSLISAESTGTKDLLFGIGEQDPGDVHILHHHLKETEIYYTLFGTGKITLDDEVYEMEPGTAVYMPPFTKHRVVNDGKETLVFLYGVNCEGDMKLTGEHDEHTGIYPPGTKLTGIWPHMKEVKKYQ